MNMTLIAAAISAALAGSIGFGAAWTLQGRTIDELKLGAANERIATQRAARQAIERATDDVRKAQESASARIAVLGRELADARKSSDGLRDTSAAAVRTVAESPETCGRITHAYDLILTESRDFIQEMAADVGRCHSERQALNDSWPR